MNELTSDETKDLWQNRAVASSELANEYKIKAENLGRIIDMVKQELTITVEDDYYRQRLLEMIERRLEDV